MSGNEQRPNKLQISTESNDSKQTQTKESNERKSKNSGNQSLKCKYSVGASPLADLFAAEVSPPVLVERSEGRLQDLVAREVRLLVLLGQTVLIPVVHLRARE